MMVIGRSTTLIPALLLSTAFAFSQDTLRLADLGDLVLENGAVIRDFRIGYRTVGELNAERSNAVLFPTWFTGTTDDLVELIGPGKMVDSSQYHVILVDAIGDGISTSPSNSLSQPGMRFPSFTIKDMVRSQHRLLTEVLKIEHLRAVMGVSMGGMQSFQWVVTYPDFMDKAIPIMGSPRLSAYDRLLWTAEIRAIKSDPAWNGGEYDSPPIDGMRTVAAINSLALTTPEAVVGETSPEKFPSFLQGVEKNIIEGFDANNWIRQAEAMMALDVSDTFGGSAEEAAGSVRSELLVIVGTRDHMVMPRPALEFARLVLARTIELDSDCGHMAIWCEQEVVYPQIARFLKK